MLTVSPAGLAAFEDAAARKRPAAFGAWCEQHAHILGPLDRFTAAALFDRYAPEAAIAGIEPMDEEIFLWVAARHRMPEMGDRQYLATMDIIFADGSDAGKLAAIDEVARTIPADGQ